MATLDDDNKGARGVEEDGISPHSAAFSVQSLGRGGKTETLFEKGEFAVL